MERNVAEDQDMLLFVRVANDNKRRLIEEKIIAEEKLKEEISFQNAVGRFKKSMNVVGNAFALGAGVVLGTIIIDILFDFKFKLTENIISLGNLFIG